MLLGRLPDEVLRAIATWLVHTDLDAFALTARRAYRCVVDGVPLERLRRDTHPGRARQRPALVFGAFTDADASLPAAVVHLDLAALREHARFARSSEWRHLRQTPCVGSRGGPGSVWIVWPPKGRGSNMRIAEIWSQLLLWRGGVPRHVQLTLGHGPWSVSVARACLDCLWLWAPTLRRLSVRFLVPVAEALAHPTAFLSELVGRICQPEHTPRLATLHVIGRDGDVWHRMCGGGPDADPTTARGRHSLAAYIVEPPSPHAALLHRGQEPALGGLPLNAPSLVRAVVATGCRAAHLRLGGRAIPLLRAALQLTILALDVTTPTRCVSTRAGLACLRWLPSLQRLSVRFMAQEDAEEGGPDLPWSELGAGPALADITLGPLMHVDAAGIDALVDHAGRALRTVILLVAWAGDPHHHHHHHHHRVHVSVKTATASAPSWRIDDHGGVVVPWWVAA